jgi:TonB family protein
MDVILGPYFKNPLALKRMKMFQRNHLRPNRLKQVLAFHLMALFLFLVPGQNTLVAGEMKNPTEPKPTRPGASDPAFSCPGQAPAQGQDKIRAPKNRYVPSYLLTRAGYSQVNPDKTGTQSSPTPATNDKAAPQYPRDHKVFTFVEQQPSFPGGEQAMNKYIRANLKYPEKALKRGKEGLVVVQFIIDRNGKILEPTIQKSLGAETDEEALRLVKTFPDFQPAKQNGRPVEFQYTLPVRFELPPKDPAKPSGKR